MIKIAHLQLDLLEALFTLKVKMKSCWPKPIFGGITILNERGRRMNHNIAALKDYELAGDIVLYKGQWYQPYYLSSGFVEFYPLEAAE
jgi:hypothetical protein